MNILYHISGWAGLSLMVLGFVSTLHFVKDPRKAGIINLCFALGIALYIFSRVNIVRDQTVRHEAIKSGRARMVIVDKYTGKTEFQWIEENSNDAPPPTD